MADKKLLVADDSLTIQKVIRLALDKEGFEIRAVSTGQDAIEEISIFKPDIVLIDVSLPDKTAFDVKREFEDSSSHNSVKFVLMSSAFEEVDEAQVAETGFHGRLVKPFDPSHLRKSLAEVLVNHPAAKAASGATALGKDLWEEPADNSEDIKKMTQETISMSGLDQFEWSINEAAKKPLSGAPIGNSSVELEYSEPELRPPSRLLDAHETTLDLAPSVPSEDIRAFDIASEAAQTAPTPQQMEDMIRQQLRETIQNMAEKLLPDIAEKIIKSEINKLLSNPPK